MEWPLDIEPALQVLVGLGLLLLLAGLGIWLWRRRRKVMPHQLELQETVTAYRYRNPAFYRMMRQFWERGLDEALLERPDVEAALRLLSTLRERRRDEVRRKDLGSSLLQLESKESKSEARQIQAAILTILRTIYLDPDLRRILPAEAESELDRLLDSLTD